MADYSLERLAERALAAKLANAVYLAELDALYVARRELRAARGIPAVAYCGMGRAGKDTSAEYVCQKLGLVYPKSSSWMILPVIAHIAGISQEQAWAERHQNREFWIDACEEVRKDDMTLIGRLCLGAGDVLVGPRGGREFHEYVAQKVVDWTVWIDNPRVPTDKTVHFKPGDCDFFVPNHGTLEQLYAKWDKLMPVLYRRN